MALELVEQVPDLVAVWIPVGGGGLAAGISSALFHLRPEVMIYAVEPTGAAPHAASWQESRRVELPAVDSVADGLLPLAIGELNWGILSAVGARAVTVEDELILKSLRRLRLDLAIPTEPSGAVAPAPLFFSDRIPAAASAPEGTHVALVSGGNVDPERLKRLLGSPD